MTWSGGSAGIWAIAIGVSSGASYGTSSWNSTQLPVWHTPPTSPPGGNMTVTHKTNITDFDPAQIGTFCETTGELADVYGADYTPTLSRPCDAIVKVKQAKSLTSSVLGIISGPDTFASHGDVLCVENMKSGSYWFQMRQDCAERQLSSRCYSQRCIVSLFPKSQLYSQDKNS
jgi:hypothetical protein